METIDISPEALNIVKSILLKHVPEHKVRAFGSRVQGTASESSDLDLVIMTETPLSTLQMADLKEEFTESDLPFKVDIID